MGGGAGGMGVLTDTLAGMVALLHRHCAGQRLIAQRTRKGGCAAFVKIGVPGVTALGQQTAEGERGGLARYDNCPRRPGVFSA